MGELLFEFLICGMAAVFLMVAHELSKALVYKLIQRVAGNKRTYQSSVFALHHYIDPVGVILSITSSVVLSKPYMFRIRDKKTNLVLGVTGFLVLAACFVGSVAAIRSHAFGVSGMETLEGCGIGAKSATLFLQYLAILSFGMFVTNLFPVSTFDMGLLIAGVSSRKYLGIIRMDGVIKLIYIITLFLDLIHYGGYRFILFLV